MADQPAPSNYTSGNITQMPSGLQAAESPMVTLLVIYVFVLLSGTLGMVLTVPILRTYTRSLTTIAVLNLIFVHFLFLVTLPFRIHYYAVGHWDLGPFWCKAVSSAIHIHLYMTFVFYVVILVTRLLAFHRRATQVEFHCRMHAFVSSLVLWAVVAVAVPCLVHSYYGNMHTHTYMERHKCFQFGRIIEDTKALNYATSSVIIVVAAVLWGLQAHALLLLYRKYGHGWRGQQVFWAQLKSMCFACIMVVCFVPYNIFRLFYITDVNLQSINEIFLSITALSCLDMLTFVGKGTCVWC